MLFWCFGITYYLRQIKLKEEIKLLILFSFAILPILPLPLRFGCSLHYLFYFYTGTYMWSHKIAHDKIKWKSIIPLAIIYVITFLFAWWQTDKLVTKALTPLYATSGCVVTYLLALKFSYLRQYPSWINQISTMTFGVYIFQQFILMGLYKYTSLHSLVGFYALPWVGFIIAIITSLTLTYLIRQTRIGRLLI